MGGHLGVHCGAPLRRDTQSRQSHPQLLLHRPSDTPAIAAIPDDAWETIEYTDAVFDETTGRWLSRAEVAEIDFTVFSAQKKADQVPGRLVVRRIPDLNPTPGQGTLFDAWRFHAFFTTTDPAVSTLWPRTRLTAATRSSSRSTPT